MKFLVIAVLLVAVCQAKPNGKDKDRDGVTTVVACERDGSNRKVKDLELRCTKGSDIVIEEAIYGRMDADVCPSDISHNNDLTCSNTVNAMDVANEECTGQESCSLEPTSEMFADPCPGTYKYLSVTYSCEEDEPVEEPIVPKWKNTGDRCVTDCSANSRYYGRYQRCDKCDAYFLCFRRWGPWRVSCPRGRSWDDNAKRCVSSSPTATCIPKPE